MDSGDASDQETPPCDPPQKQQSNAKRVVEGDFHACCYGNQRQAIMVIAKKFGLGTSCLYSL